MSEVENLNERAERRAAGIGPPPVTANAPALGAMWDAWQEAEADLRVALDALERVYRLLQDVRETHPRTFALSEELASVAPLLGVKSVE